MPVLSPPTTASDLLTDVIRPVDPLPSPDLSGEGSQTDTKLTMIMRSYVLGALRESEQGDATKYKQLIATLTMDPTLADAPSPKRLYIWISILGQCVSRLDKNHAPLVEAILSLDWAVRDADFVDVYIEFLENLVSAHAFYSVPVMDTIARQYVYRQTLPSYAQVTRSKIYARAHHAVQSVLRLIPTSVNALHKSLAHMIPYPRQHVAAQATYAKNILDVSRYVPYLRKQILNMLIYQMVKIDSHIQIELDELEEEVEFHAYSMNFDEEYASDSDSDSEDEYDSDDDEPVAELNREKRTRLVQSMSRKLDAMMLLVFQYLESYARDADAAERSELYFCLLDIFDHNILRTLKSRYTQFILFYYCSLDANVFAEHFMQHLIDHIADVNRPRITRIACAAYMASYVARAKFLDASSVQRAVNMLCQWCNQYVNQFEADIAGPNAAKYDVFYAAMQAIMYIFCFRHQDLLTEGDVDSLIDEPAAPVQDQYTPLIVVGDQDAQAAARKWCAGLRSMPRLVMSRYNPLKMCSPMVVQQFARLAHQANFMYVYPILAKNKETVLGVPSASSADDDQTSTKVQELLTTVQSFFPFDPYTLESSKSYIDVIYLGWQSGEGESDSEEDESDSEDEDDEEDDEDEEEESMRAGITAMSISPSPNHFMV